MIKYFQMIVCVFGLVREMVLTVEESEVEGKERHTAVLSGLERVWLTLVEKKPKLARWPVGEILEIADSIIPGMVKMLHAVGLFAKKKAVTA